MQVQVFATLRELVGARQVDVPLQGESTVREVLCALAGQHPGLAAKFWNENGEWKAFVTVLVNGRAMEYAGGLDARLTPADKVALFPPVGGG